MDRRSYLRVRYGRSQAIVHALERLRLEILLHRIGPLGTVLDVPCGFGRFSRRLGRAARERLVSSDRSRERLREVQTLRGPDGRPLPVVEADLTGDLPFRSDQFDLVFTFRFVQHVRDEAMREHLVAELLRISRAYLILSYYRPTRVHTWRRATSHRGRTARGLSWLSSAAFRRLVERHGGRVLSDEPVLPLLHANRIALLEKAIRPER